MVMPRGRRNSEPTPLPIASGKAPSSAAMVVIMMGAETQQASFVDSIEGRLDFFALGFERKINHHDGVFLDDADQQNQANEGDDTELHLEEQKRQDGSHTRGGKRGENGDGVNIALIEHTQHNIDSDERGKNQHWLVGEGI